MGYVIGCCFNINITLRAKMVGARLDYYNAILQARDVVSVSDLVSRRILERLGLISSRDVET